jgi:pyridine nucleotide-disulfide oxidoreductase family protein
VKRILLIGAGHAHLAVLRSLREEPLHGARFALVSPRAKQIYSGMLPGVIAGHYRRHEAEIDVTRLAEAAYAEFIEGEVAKLDPNEKLAILKDGAELEFDLVSINVGALVERSIRGAHFALPVKPHEPFYDKLKTAKLNRVAIAGGGITGAEIAMALRYRGAAVTVYSETPELWPPHTESVLRRMGVDVRPGMPVSEIERGPTIISGSTTQDFDLVLLATAAAPQDWLRGTGLPCDEQGFLLVDDMLRSVGHPEVFAAGDCATLSTQPLPRSGVFALRQGETLATSFRRVAQGEPPVAYRPQRHALVLISCGRRYALAQRGDWSAEGRWVWWWKNHIDRRWINSLTV